MKAKARVADSALAKAAGIGENIHMGRLFSFCFRLLLSFLGAQFLVRLFGLEGFWPLCGVCALLLGNIYLLEHLNFRERFPRTASAPPPPLPEPPPPEPPLEG